MEKTTANRMLPCKLTDEELRARGKLVAELAAQKHQVELQAKDAAAEYKAQIARKDTAIDDLFKQLRSGEEHRDVQVEIAKDYRAKTATTTRLDTGELIDTRALTPAELQLELGGRKPLPSVADPKVQAEIDAEIDAHEKKGRR